MIFRALSNKERIQLVFSLSLLFFFLIPNFILRAGIASFALIFILSSISEIKRETVFLFLFLFYSLAYFYSPYCIFFPAGIFRIISLVLLFMFGLFWAYQASAPLKLNFKLENKFLLILLGVMVYLINYIPLGMDIPWRGDEDYHIESVITLSGLMDFVFRYFVLSVIALILLIVINKVFLRLKFPAYKKIIIFTFLSIMPFLCIILSPPWVLSRVYAVALRYPFIQKWFNLLFVFPDMYGSISLYRAIPFLSALFISFFLFYKFNEAIKNKWEALFLAFSMITVPLLYFYSSLLYLEMPIVLLMTICVFDLKSLIFLKNEELLTRPSWYCLLLISFFKETVLVFLLFIITARIIYQVRFIEKSKERLFQELKNAFLILCPLFIYLFFRIAFVRGRKYGMEFSSLFKVSNYFVFGRALFDQLGILSIIMAAGLLLLLKKDKFTGMISLLLFLSLSYFFVLDGSYIGYSRWNLFLMPIVFLAAFNFISAVPRYLRIGIIFALLFSNVILSPFHLDGARLPNWGSPKVDTAEYVYPYDKAMKWLSSQRDIYNVLVIGNYYHYRGFNFYFNKYNFHPQIDELQFSSHRFDKDTELFMFHSFFFYYTQLKDSGIGDVSLMDEREQLLSVDTILYHSINNIDLDDKILYGGVFKVIKKISNSEHSLYILRKVI